MSEEPLRPLKIDVETWRRDIQTFVDTTMSELDSINRELAGGVSAQSLEVRFGNQSPGAAADGGSSVTRTDDSQPQPLPPTCTDQRLTQLKQKIDTKLENCSTDGQLELVKNT